MTSRPILFSAPMIRALLAGRKTQTRRVVKWPEWVEDQDSAVRGLNFGLRVGLFRDGMPKKVFACPYGQPGDELWVRETWAELQPTAHEEIARAHGDRVVIRPDDDLPTALWYRADGELPAVEQLFSGDEDGIRWRPSIHMPRWASRITLRVTSVRVERLQAISEADAKAEGAEPLGIVLSDVDGRSQVQHVEGLHRKGFAVLWESINGAGSWAANPWVWVVGFEVLP